MPKKPPCETKKLRGPLYGAAWVGKYCIVAGGGGGGNFGIPNSISCIEHNDGRIGETASTLALGDEAPLRMTVSSNDAILVVAVSSGGLCLVHLNVQSHPPVLERLEDNAELRGLGDVKSIDFSSNNQLLAVGTEQGYVHVFAWPSARRRVSFRCGDKSGDSVRDLSFSSSHNNRVLATVHQNGSCKLWDLVTGSLIQTLRIPSESQAVKKNARDSPRFSQVRFMSSVDPRTGLRVPTLVAGLITGKQSELMTWAQNGNGQLQLTTEVPAHKAPITALALSRDGAFLGCSSGDGNLALFSTRSWRCIRRANGAHIVFATAAAFSSDSRGFISVSADSSLCTLPVDSQAGSSSSRSWLFILTVLVALLAVILSLTRSDALYVSALFDRLSPVGLASGLNRILHSEL